MKVKAKTAIRLQDRYMMPGEEAELPDTVASKLLNVGLVTAMIEAPENAMVPRAKPRHVGGGWYELSNGKKVRKKDLEEGD